MARPQRTRAAPSAAAFTRIEQGSRDVRHNASLRSRLGRLLRSQGRDQLIRRAVRARLGILLTAAAAFLHDIQPFVAADAVAEFCAEDHSMALRWIARTGVVCTTDRLIRHLLHGRAAQST